MSLSSVTLALRNLIQAAIPTKVEVTTLPLALAEKFVKLGAWLARVNIVCHQVSPSPNLRNISLTRIDSPAIHGPKTSPLNALYLITIYGTPSPEQEQSTEHLLESIYRAFDQKPLLTSADLEAALPGVPGGSAHASARIVLQALSFAETESLFTSMNATHRPTLAYQVTVADE
jgi:Pvc16 N-terminal domain